MPKDVMEFADATAFERFVLDRAMPLLPTSEARSVIDLRGPGVSVAVTPVPARVYAGDVAGTVKLDLLRPLIFGAAWKVLDLLIEFATGKQGSIKSKAEKAAADRVPAVLPFDGQHDLWIRLMRLYASTTTLRHSLVHRQLKIDAATGHMEGTIKPGEPPPRPITAAEQTAFCQAAQGTAEAVIAGAGVLSGRQRDQLSWVLDQLEAHHEQPSLGGSPVHGVIPVVVVDAEPLTPDEVAVDPPQILNRARQGTPDRSHFDLRLHLPDGRLLAGSLEDAPARRVTFSIDNPPGWLRWV
jgi:hypothetical protein